MRAVDTNVLVRLLARDDEMQLAMAESFVRAGAWISQLVLTEASCSASSDESCTLLDATGAAGGHRGPSFRLGRRADQA